MNSGTAEIDDPFWTEITPLFKGTFRYYRSIPIMVQGNIHTSDEKYHLGRVDFEIVPIAHRTGPRTYVMMHPFIVEPNIVLTVGLYQQSEHVESSGPIGEIVSSKLASTQKRELGNAQAWYYPLDRTIVIWECYLYGLVRDAALLKDRNTFHLWTTFEKWLKKRFPDSTRIATPLPRPFIRWPGLSAVSMFT